MAQKERSEQTAQDRQTRQDQVAELPMLAGIGNTLRWVEELLVMVSGPVLTFALGVGAVDLFTDGQVLANVPQLLIVWGVAMAVGVDGQLIGASVKCGRAFRAQQWAQAVGYTLMIGALGYVAYLAAIVFATTESEGISTAQALHQLGMDNTTWIVQRCVVAVALVILSGVLRYDPVKKAVETPEMRAEREARELAEIRHRNAKRQAQAQGWRTTITTAIAKPKPDESTPIDGANDAQTDASMGVDSGGESTGFEVSKAGASRGRKAGQPGVPSDMMSAPMFRAYLAQSGVNISSEKSVAHVQSVEGSRKVGTTYCARKAPLMKLANRLIRSAQTTGNAEGEEAV